MAEVSGVEGKEAERQAKKLAEYLPATAVDPGQLI